MTDRPLTVRERGRARTHKLTDPVVVALLASYLYRELVNVHGVQHVSIGVLRARRETNESSAREARRNRIANAPGATRARTAILGG